MADEQAPKKKRTIKKRPRRVPNPQPGFEGYRLADPVLADLASKAPRKPVEASQALEQPAPDRKPPLSATILASAAEAEPTPDYFVPKGILAIEHLGDTKHLADDFTTFTPEQRKFWRGAKNKHRRIKDADKRAFIDELNRLPSVAGAAKKSGFTVRSWYCLRARDKSFAAEWDAAIEAGIPALEHAAMVRAFHGVERPIFQNGQRVGSELVMSDRLAEVLLRAHKPERYSEKLMVAGQVNGTVRHVHELSPATADLVRSIAGMGAPKVVDGTAERVNVPAISTAAGLVEQMLGKAAGAQKAQDVVPSEPDNEAESGKERK